MKLSKKASLPTVVFLSLLCAHPAFSDGTIGTYQINVSAIHNVVVEAKPGLGSNAPQFGKSYFAISGYGTATALDANNKPVSGSGNAGEFVVQVPVLTPLVLTRLGTPPPTFDPTVAMGTWNAILNACQRTAELVMSNPSKFQMLIQGAGQIVDLNMPNPEHPPFNTIITAAEGINCNLISASAPAANKTWLPFGFF